MTDPHRPVDPKLWHCVSGQIPCRRFPKGSRRFATIGEALAHWSALPLEERPGVIEIDDNSTYSEEISEIELPQGASLDYSSCQ